MTTTVLVTGFEPFGDDRENASERAVALLADTWDVTGVRLVTTILPVSFAEARRALDRAVAEHAPDAVVAVGEAGGRTAVTPETTARNLDDARIPDNTGGQPRDRVIDRGGPETLPTRLDAAALVRACRADGIPAELSDDAGGFVCNHVFHHLLSGTGVPAGFVHVPAVRSVGVATVGAETDPESGAEVRPAITLDQCAAAVGHAVRAAAASAATARPD